MSLSTTTVLTSLHPRHLKRLAFILAPPLLHALYTDYSAYHVLGASALPRNPFGWVVSRLSGWILSRESRSTARYQVSLDTRQFLTRIPIRHGTRPTLSSYAMPHRQLTEHTPPSLMPVVLGLVVDVHAEYPSTTELKASEYEKHRKAIFVADKEVVHVHESDGSLHVLLSPRDCISVVEKGWGERHPFAGSLGGMVLPAEYLLIYAPRNMEEMKVVEEIMKAAVKAVMEDGAGNQVPGGWR